mmetsp:Transcript_19387/g.50391  ORF Transcript_19387/g.50391 Transcript_19387/m.50391 type:complete len:240 (+) Transcript_19387:1021-1740(+)
MTVRCSCSLNKKGRPPAAQPVRGAVQRFGWWAENSAGPTGRMTPCTPPSSRRHWMQLSRARSSTPTPQPRTPTEALSSRAFTPLLKGAQVMARLQQLQVPTAAASLPRVCRGQQKRTYTLHSRRSRRRSRRKCRFGSMTRVSCRRPFGCTSPGLSPAMPTARPTSSCRGKQKGSKSSTSIQWRQREGYRRPCLRHCQTGRLLLPARRSRPASRQSSAYCRPQMFWIPQTPLLTTEPSLR